MMRQIIRRKNRLVNELDIFDEKNATKELKYYRKKGARKVTRLLVNCLTEAGIQNLSLLDIGAGVGVIQHELFKEGLKSATNVDASSAYLNCSKEEGRAQGNADKTAYQFGNFIELAPDISPADIVTLDKVVCCYDDASALMISSLAKSKRYYALVFPKDAWWVKIGHNLFEFWLWLKRSKFRSYIHPVEQIEGRILSAGFRLVVQKSHFTWWIQLYEKNVK